MEDLLHRVCPSLSPTRKGGERGTPPKNQSHPQSQTPNKQTPLFLNVEKETRGSKRRRPTQARSPVGTFRRVALHRRISVRDFEPSKSLDEFSGPRTRPSLSQQVTTREWPRRRSRNSPTLGYPGLEDRTTTGASHTPGAASPPWLATTDRRFPSRRWKSGCGKPPTSCVGRSIRRTYAISCSRCCSWGGHSASRRGVFKSPLRHHENPYLVGVLGASAVAFRLVMRNTQHLAVFER